MLCISSLNFGLSPVGLCFFLLLFHLPSSFQTTDCEFLKMPGVTELQACVKYLQTAGAVSSVSCVAIASPCIVPAGLLSEAEGNILLGAETWTATAVAVKGTKWTTVNFKAKTVRSTGGNPFMFLVISNRNLKTLNLPDIAMTLKVVDCPRLDVKAMLTLAIQSKKNSHSVVPLHLATCAESPPIVDLTAIDEVCKFLTSKVTISGPTVDKMPQRRQFGLDKRSCLHIENTNLKSLAFLKFAGQKVLPPQCKGKIANNKLLCLSKRDRLNLVTMYPFPVQSMEIMDNDDACVHQCPSADFVAGKVADPAKCFSLKGPVLLEGDAAASRDFGNIYEIREGGLTIRDTHTNYWSKFTNLRSIDTGTTAGPALSITEVRLASPAEFDRMNLIQIWAENVTGQPIVIRDNVGFMLPLKEYYSLGNLTNKPVDLGSESIPTEAPLATTIVVDDGDLAALLSTWWFYAGIAAVVLLVIGVIVAPILFFKCRNRAPFSLPAVPHPAGNKTGLLSQLADEILQRNPLEWSQLAQQETTKLVPMKERENEIRVLRAKYEKFVEYTFRREPVHFQQSTDNIKSSNAEIYQYFKEYQRDNPNNCKMMLLSTSKDPSKSIPLFSGIVSEPTVLKGTFADVPQRLSQYSCAETRGDKFEIKSTLKERKDYNNDIFTYRYQVELSEAAETPVSFSLELIHFHKWSESSDDWRTILQLLEYGRGKKPPIIVTSNPSQSFAVMMLTAVLCHVADKTYPDTMTIAEMRKLVSHRVDCPYPADLWLLYALMVVVSWADGEHVIPEQKKTQFKDFGYILKKMNDYVASNPNNFFIKPENLKMEKSVTKRVQRSRDSNKPEQSNKPLEESDSVSDFKKQSASDSPGIV